MGPTLNAFEVRVILNTPRAIVADLREDLDAFLKMVTAAEEEGRLEPVLYSWLRRRAASMKQEVLALEAWVSSTYGKTWPAEQPPGTGMR